MKTSASPIRYVAQLTHVREVSLLGTANLDFWTQQLENENLRPAERDGQAQILIVAAEGRFMGVRFREVSFSVLVDPREEDQQPGAYLVQAFNSRRLLAFCERTFFSTPYDYAEVHLAASLPASIQVVKDGQALFRAGMRAAAGASGREPLRRGEEGWEGPVFLPAAPHGKKRRGRMFFARVSGDTQTYRFLPAEDSILWAPSSGAASLHALAESGFAGHEWAIRQNATHAKSKTYKITRP